MTVDDLSSAFLIFILAFVFNFLVALSLFFCGRYDFGLNSFNSASSILTPFRKFSRETNGLNGGSKSSYTVLYD